MFRLMYSALELNWSNAKNSYVLFNSCQVYHGLVANVITVIHYCCHLLVQSIVSKKHKYEHALSNTSVLLRANLSNHPDNKKEGTEHGP
jgi:hypothetical protein